MKFQQIKNFFPNISVARYNLAVWQQPLDSLCFIGREVANAGAVGEPDTGILKLFEVNKEGVIIQERVIWSPIYEGINLEDPRVLQSENENLIICLSAILRDKKGTPVPFPAIVKIDSLISWKQELPPFLIIGTFGAGKNLTPIDDSTYLFRPEGVNYFHRILVFSLISQIPEKLGEIEFPTDLPWASYKIGTTMPPIWITQNEALFIIHGISVQKIDGLEKFVYHIGRAKLIRKNNSFKVIVAPDPILTPDDFLDKDGKPLVQELHPETRRVVYACGGVIKKTPQETLSLYVNVGDRTTYEVEFSLDELKKDLF
jgi:predicted GH43/DUF377 family glycosyl hydrolase